MSSVIPVFLFEVMEMTAFWFLLCKQAVSVLNRPLKVQNVRFSMLSVGGDSRVQKTGSHSETLSNDPHGW